MTIPYGLQRRIDDLLIHRLHKPYRVFKRHNVYEYYANTGRADYEHYARNGKLVGAYNAAAQAWAKFI